MTLEKLQKVLEEVCPELEVRLEGETLTIKN